MSEEEKKALDYLKNDVVYWLDKGKDFVVIDIGENEKLHTILNLIEKQQEEIYDFKTENKIMKRIIKENKLWETLLNDNEFVRYLYEEN